MHLNEEWHLFFCTKLGPQALLQWQQFKLANIGIYADCPSRQVSIFYFSHLLVNLLYCAVLRPSRTSVSLTFK